MRDYLNVMYTSYRNTFHRMSQILNCIISQLEYIDSTPLFVLPLTYSPAHLKRHPSQYSSPKVHFSLCHEFVHTHSKE